MKLKDIIPLLPKYTTNNAYGKIGEVKGTTIFCYGNGRSYIHKELTQELIDNTIVKEIQPIGSAYGNHCSMKLCIWCIDIREKEGVVNE